MFEPPSESEIAKQELALFDKAVAAEKRDYNLLFDNTTDGLYNESKEMQKVAATNETEYGPKLAVHINATHKSVVAGYLSESDAKSTKMYSTTGSYLSHKNEKVTNNGVSKPDLTRVFVFKESKRNKTKTKLKCFYCQKPNHFTRKSSRKVAGLPRKQKQKLLLDAKRGRFVFRVKVKIRQATTAVGRSIVWQLRLKLQRRSLCSTQISCRKIIAMAITVKPQTAGVNTISDTDIINELE